MIYKQTLGQAFQLCKEDWKPVLLLSFIIWILNYLLGSTMGAGAQSPVLMIFAIVASLFQMYLHVLIVLRSNDLWKSKAQEWSLVIKEASWGTISFILYTLLLLMILLFAGGVFGLIFYLIFSKFLPQDLSKVVLPILTTIPTTLLLSTLLTPFFLLPWIAVIDQNHEQSYLKMARTIVKKSRWSLSLLIWMLLLFFVVGNVLEFVSMGAASEETLVWDFFSALFVPVGIILDYFLVGLYWKLKEVSLP